MDIHLHKLTKTFGPLRANDAISLQFTAGKIHGILGENGAGKSTLMKLLSGFLRPDSGDIFLGTQRVVLNNPADGLRAGIGMIYQEPLDVPAFTALENFFCASPKAIVPNRAAARNTLRQLTKELGFSVQPDDYITGLTVGQRQQLEMMRLLGCGVQVLILDEPTTGISATQKKALFTALRHLAHEGKTILFVSHKLDEIDELCDTATVLRAGCVMGDGQFPMPQKREHLLNLMFGQESQRIVPSMPVQTFFPSLPYPVWRLKNITMQERTLALRNISLDIRAGMILGLAGLEGSGQQLLLRLLAGLSKPNTGRILLNGKDMTGFPLAAFQRDGVHYLPADRMTSGIIGPFSLVDHLALTKTTTMLLPNRSILEQEAQEAIAEYDIRATPFTPLESLSGGNQQRAMLSLIPPRCTGLLLEQPTRGLDVTSAWAVWKRLQARCADGMALVFSSADLDELLEFSDEILVFCGGNISAPIPRTQLSALRVAELIGGVGFDE